MITRTIAGLSFEVISPSFYRLEGFPEIDLSYVGRLWYLHVPDALGQPQMYPAETRDKAAELVRFSLEPEIQI